MSVAEPSSVNVHSGDILADKYRVDRVLGQGGMGVVVLAEHIELRERVAIKFLLDEAAGNVELAERFIREARAAVRIKSEHVVRVIDVGRLPSGAPYMVMEYLEGQDLSERLLSGPLPIEDAVDYVIQCCEAMHVAHRAGIVHRDLKPANLFLTQRPDGSPLIKILDFGISKVKSPDAAQLSLTHTQAMMGSPLYMSPEQMRSSKDVSASADLWSLGVILHELISGDVPFTGETFPEVLVKVMGEAPPSLRSLRPEVPEGLDAVVRRCLEKRPADRYSSVAALAVALTPFASQRTSGLQSRLASSMTDPPLGAPRGLGATALIGGVPAQPPIIVPARVTAPFVPGVPVEARPNKTNTAWDAQAPVAPVLAVRARRRTALLVAGSLFLVTVVTAGLLRSRSPALDAAVVTPPAATTGAAAAAEPASPAPTPAQPRVAPIDPAAVASAPSAEPPAAAPASPATTGVTAAVSAGIDTAALDTAAIDRAAPNAAASASDAARAEPTPPAVKARVSGSASTKAPRVRAGANARVATDGAAAATPPATKPRPKPLSIEFK
jgi:eukaryotic-like serine/threonine-protein kinase